jgi:SAM-dependent methyltransferase
MEINPVPDVNPIPLPPPAPPAPAHANDTYEQQLRELPAFRALLRAVEARFYNDLPMPHPILDLGCGDGHFASVTFREPLDVGFDPWERPLQEARRRGVYHTLSRADGARMPFPDAAFVTVISNSVLEHIPNVEPVIHEVSRVLRPGEASTFVYRGRISAASFRGAAAGCSTLVRSGRSLPPPV